MNFCYLLFIFIYILIHENYKRSIEQRMFTYYVGCKCVKLRRWRKSLFRRQLALVA